MTAPTHTQPASLRGDAPAKRERVFSGIQPSGNIHIGNLLGAVRNWVRDQDKFDNIYCIVDLHAITVPQDPTKLRGKRRELAALLMACGLDPERCIIFMQSDVPAHTQLAWILGCVTTIGQLKRMTQFKVKAGNDQDLASSGLFTYPVLMAADILLYHADAVPVGDDQRQHIELTRDLVERFNYRFGETFTVPRALIPEVGARIMALDEPDKKMSKSGADNSLIALTDGPDVIRRKIRRATTDSGTTVVFDESRAGLYNLLTIYELLGDQSRPAIEADFAGKGYGAFKAALTDRIVAALEPIQRRFQALMDDPAELDRLMARGADRARPIAEATLRTAMERVGYH
ncbi:MAG TPA: tryptophan--tRNA ligase [Ktedonobacterales bacterium]